MFKTTFGGNTGIRYAINLAFKNALTGEYPDFAIDLTKLIFAEGGVYTTDIVTVEKTADAKLKIDWDATILAGSNADDTINLVFYNETSNQALLMNTDIQRSTATTTVEMPPIWKGATIHCWLYFSNAATTTCSNSQYISSVDL
ncbi:MAG: hypothetical protein RIS29_1042 [Bacteroidota bacterium]